MKMVKDNWANSKSDSSNSNININGLESSPSLVQTSATANRSPISVTLTSITQKHNDLETINGVNQVTGSNAWGCYESKENFINLHFC